MFLLRNFTPYASTSVVTGTSAVTAFPAMTQASGGPPVTKPPTVMIQNTGSALAFFKFVTDAGGTADANSVALQPGCAMVFDTGMGDLFAPPNDGSGKPIVGVALFSSVAGAINIAVGIGS